eukprot:707730_1
MQPVQRFLTMADNTYNFDTVEACAFPTALRAIFLARITIPSGYSPRKWMKKLCLRMARDVEALAISTATRKDSCRALPNHKMTFAVSVRRHDLKLEMAPCISNMATAEACGDRKDT